MKKRFMRIMSMLMVLVMTLGMCVTSFAADPTGTDPDPYIITVENSIGGKTYSAYKIFDATYSGDGDDTIVSYSIKSNSPWFDIVKAAVKVFSLTEGSTEGEGVDAVITYYVSVKEGVDDADVIAVFTGIDVEKLGGFSFSATGKGNGGTLDLKVGEPGYYYVTTGSGTVVSVDTAAPTATIVDKNEKPGEGGKDPEDPDWKGGFTKEADDLTYSIGDEVEYVIRSYVPTYDEEKQVVSYTITDTMSKGLTLNTKSDGSDSYDVKVEIAGTGTAYTNVTGSCTITVSNGPDDTTILTVSWDIDELNEKVEDFTYPADAVVKITYIATVNEHADDVDLHNEVEMSWKKIDDEDGKTENNPEVDVYTFGFELNKTDKDGNPLTGAQFTLKKQTDTDPQGEPVYGDEISFVYDSDSNTYEESDGTAVETTTTITVENGQVNIWGLGEGTYILTEKKAPEGYNLLDNPVTIIITALKVEDTEGNEIVTGWTVKVTGEDGSSTGTFDNAKDHGIGTMASITVKNSAGASLPSTGGIGTAIFYMVGTLLVLAAAALVVAKIRLGKTE